MQGHGETLAAIAELAGVRVAELRAVLRAAGAPTAARPDALGGANSAAAQPLGADAAPADGVGEVG